MAGYCTSVQLYCHEPQVSENTAQVQYSAILPSQSSNNRFIIYHSDLAAPRRQTATAHVHYKVIAGAYLMSFSLPACFQLWMAPAHVPIPLTVEESTIKLLNNAIFFRTESLFVVAAAATNAFQLEHTPWLLCSISSVGCRIQTIEYWKVLVMYLYRKYYWYVYQVHNKVNDPDYISVRWCVF